ncbi:MAG: redoxin domain-containing protein [Bacteroidia bacterium]
MIIIFASISLLFSCSKPEPLIKGKLSNASGEMIWLQDANTSKPTSLDSVKLDANGEFAFNTKLPAKGFYNLMLAPGNFATLILDPSEKVNVSGDAKNLGYTYKTEGSADTKLFMDFNAYAMENRRKVNAIKQKQDSVQGVFQYYLNANKDPKKMSHLSDSLSHILEPMYNTLGLQSMALLKEGDTWAGNFIDKNPSSFANLAVLQLFSDKEASFPYFEKVSISMKKKYPEQKNLQAFYDYVDKMNKLSIGSVAPEIKLNNPEGKDIALSSLKGKVVLVDFWASWCGPCRKENPHVREIYHTYHDKGFEVYSVSLDDNKASWMKAIADDSLIWVNHVSELKKWQSAVVPQYEIKGIPMTVLLDRQGRIIAKNLRGDQLAAKVAEALK